MKLLKIGKVLKPHGFKGSFTVSTTTGKESALKSAAHLYIGTDENSVHPYKVTEAAWMPKAWKMTVEGVTSDTEVNSLRDLGVYIEREAMPATRSGEFYLSDLMGLAGIDNNSQKCIGFFTALQELAIAQTDIIQHTWIFTNETGETLQVPAVPHFILRVDLENKKIYLNHLKELEEE